MPKPYRALVSARRNSGAIRAACSRIELVEARILLSVSLDANGWTQITPQPNDQVIYVSSSQGDDNNDGLSPDTPVASLAVGVSRLRDGTGDELLLKAGDTWTSGLGVWRKSGASADDPMVIGSYGAGPRPLLMTGADDGFSATGASNPQIDNVAIMGIQFDSSGRDPSSANFDPSSTAIGIDVITQTSGFLVENCLIQGYTNDMVIEQYFGPITNVTIRRDVVADSYSINSHSQGIYANGITNLDIEDNVFDHNGYNDAVPGAQATWFNHDVYLAANNVNVTVQGNIFAEASGYGLEDRPGGVVENNLFLNDPVGMSFGLVNGADVTPGGVSGTVSGNVFEGGANIGDVPLGEGMEVGNIQPGASTVISNNIFTQSIPDAPAAITLQIGKGDSNPQDAVGINDLAIQNNVIYDWSQGIHIDSGFTAGGAGPAAFNNVSIDQNDFQDISGTVLQHDDPLYSGQETWSGNRYDNPTGVMNVGGVNITAAQWAQDNEPNGVLDTVAYADPTRTVETYDAAMGGPGTLADFLAHARSQSQQSWQIPYDAQTVLAYIRDGFVDEGAAPRNLLTAAAPIASASMAATALDRDTSIQFAVTYSGQTDIDASTVGSGNVTVLCTDTNSTTGTTLVSTSGQGSTMTATYSFSPPGGAFKKGKSQDFSLIMNVDQVRDANGLAVAASSLGAFKVHVLPRPKPPTVKNVRMINHDQGILFTFSADIASIPVDALVLTSSTGQIIDPSLMTLSTGGTANTALWSLSGLPLGELPAGSWHVRLKSPEIIDDFGNPLDGDGDGVGGDLYDLPKSILIKLFAAASARGH